MIILFTAVGFLCGSFMFSYWLGLIAKRNLKVVGDGNPGAFNLWKSAGFKFGIAGIILDFMKGYLPLALLVEGGYIVGFETVPIAIAPIIGHAFSPFLKFKGGKAIAVTFGVWSALTRFEVALVYAIILCLFMAVTKMLNKGKPLSSEADGFQVVLGMLLLSVYLYFRHFPNYILWFWLINFLILAFTHKIKLLAFFKSRVTKRTRKSDDRFSA